MTNTKRMDASGIDVTPEVMKEVWATVVHLCQAYRAEVVSLPVAPALVPAALRSDLSAYDFSLPRAWPEVLTWLDAQIRAHQVHLSHPRYFGLFNPAPAPFSVAADALVAAYNPQLAAWSHSPFAAEVERHLIKEFATRFGFDRESADGTFCSGGAEANHTALLCALTTKYPAFAEEGLRAIPEQPVIYISEDAHHSWVKAARACGLGSSAVRPVALDAQGRLSLDQLAEAIRADRQRGFSPCLVCGTAGTTNAGIIDPLKEVAQICRQEDIWYHVDAAWGGAACVVPEFRAWLQGIEQADSITFDAHKFLSVTMGAGMFFCKRPDALHQTFRITTGYMPRDAAGLDIADPYAHSMQWSRRSIGIKLFLPLAIAGWDGYAVTIRHQTDMGNRLRQLLAESGWRCLNETPLPIVCFVDPENPDPNHAELIAKAVVASGSAWISPTHFGRPCIRACITNFRTRESDLQELVARLNEARDRLGATNG